TSVLGLKFSGGVLLAADMVGSYGSLARFRGISRLLKVNNSTVLGASGDVADFQHLRQLLEQMVIDEELLGDGHSYSPRAVHSWLTRVLYNRRSAPSLATGFGAYLAQPLLRAALERDQLPTREEARDLLERCLKVLYYRDARSFNRVCIPNPPQIHPKSILNLSQNPWEPGIHPKSTPNPGICWRDASRSCTTGMLDLLIGFVS
ncbi:proteasome subunit beta type-4-like, partial [Malurus melanocephalus]|uniref:proteasome subunit beta type-4-like n=1 Tax=Malurus melanocephalus TaxID=175006 RepID=UPI002546DDB1